MGGHKIKNSEHQGSKLQDYTVFASTDRLDTALPLHVMSVLYWETGMPIVQSKLPEL